MPLKEKSKAEIGLEEKRHALFIQSRLSNAVLEEKKKLEKEGYEIPATSLSVQGDIREYWNPEKYFVKCYPSFINDIKSNYNLSITESGIVYMLSNYISYENNLLCKYNGDPIQKKDLCEILGMAHNAVDKYMSLLVAKGVLAKLKVKKCVHYYMNPYIFYKGNRIDNTLFNMFKNTK